MSIVKVLMLAAMIQCHQATPDSCMKGVDIDDMPAPTTSVMEARAATQEDVLDWAPEVTRIERLDTYEVLALIHIESEGKVYARRPESRYYGLLQISDAYIEDALGHAGRNKRPASYLMGRGVKSISVFQWYMEKYAYLHGWDDRRVAALHKVGPTALHRILSRARRRGMTFERSLCIDQTPGSCEYMRRYKKWKQVYKTDIEHSVLVFLRPAE